MEREDISDEEIIQKELFITEEDKMIEVKEITELVKSFLKIDAENHRFIFLDPWFELSNYEKIAILLCVRYLGSIVKVFPNKFMTLPEIADEMKDVQTTLSAPLNRLIKERSVNIVALEKKRGYKINEMSIKKILKKIQQKNG